MKTNTFIDSIIKEMSTQLWRVTDKERESYYNQIGNLNPQKQASNYQSVYARDFFNFYLKDLEFTPSQFISTLNNDKSLIEFLYGYYTSYIANRREFQDIFEDTIRQNPKLFTLAIEKCLDDHQNPYATIEKDPGNKEIAAQIERNTEDFKRLLLLGEIDHQFRKIPKESLYTKNTHYKNLMQEKGLLDNEVFDEKKLIELFNESVKYSRNINFDRVTEYCIFHMKDVVEKFDTPGAFNVWAATHVNKKNSDGKELHYIDDTRFFSLITSSANKEIKVYQDKFIEQWTDSMPFRQSISTGYSSDFTFLQYHPHKIESFLSKFTNQEKVGLMQKGMRDLNFTKSYNDFKSFIIEMPLDHVSPIYHATVIDKIIDFRKSISNSNDMMADNAFFSAALNYLVAKSLKSISNYNLSDDDKTQVKQDILSVYAKNNDIIVSFIYNNDDAINQNIQNLENNFKELRLHAKELNLSSNFFEEIESRASNKLELFYLKLTDKSNYQPKVEEGIKASIKVVSALGIYSALDKLNLIDVKFSKSVTSYKNKRMSTKYLDSYPAVFEIIENTKDKGILSWIFQEKHISALKEEILYKNKNVIEYFSAADDATRGSESNIERIFEVIMENKTVFKELVLSKKKIMKAVQGLESNFIQTSLDFVNLDNSLARNEEPVKRVSNKL
jgi:hypothetical protein